MNDNHTGERMSDFSDRIDGFERRVADIQTPKLIMAEICRTATHLVDFACVLKLSGEQATGWIADSVQELPGDAMDAFVLDAAEVTAIRVVTTTRIPMSMENLATDAVKTLLRARGLSAPRPVTIFPIGIGSRIPFILYVDRETPLNAAESGLMTRMLMSAGLAFSALIVRKRNAGATSLQRPKTPAPRRVTRLMAANWASEYKSGDAASSTGRRAGHIDLAPVKAEDDLELTLADISELLDEKPSETEEN